MRKKKNAVYKNDKYEAKYYECPICGEVKYISHPKEYVFKRGSKKDIYLCGWNCCLEWERQEEARKKARKEANKEKMKAINKKASIKRAETIRKKKGLKK